MTNAALAQQRRVRTTHRLAMAKRKGGEMAAGVVARAKGNATAAGRAAAQAATDAGADKETAALAAASGAALVVDLYNGTDEELVAAMTEAAQDVVTDNMVAISEHICNRIMTYRYRGGEGNAGSAHDWLAMGHSHLVRRDRSSSSSSAGSAGA